MSVRFVYFDLGNVLIRFSVHRMISQLVAVTEKSETEVRSMLFDYQRYRSYEIGETSTEEFLSQVYESLQPQEPNRDDLIHAINDVFWANDPILQTCQIRRPARNTFKHEPAPLELS